MPTTASYILFAFVDAGRAGSAIQELAGHQEIGTTQRYMHLSPAAIASAIGLLERRESVSAFGDTLETGASHAKNEQK